MSTDVVPLILNLGTGEWITSRPGSFVPDRESQYALNRMLGGPQSQSGSFGEEKTPLSLSEFEPGTLKRIV
jgi:hypothetical protein